MHKLAEALVKFIPRRRNKPILKALCQGMEKDHWCLEQGTAEGSMGQNETGEVYGS